MGLELLCCLIRRFYRDILVPEEYYCKTGDRAPVDDYLELVRWLDSGQDVPEGKVDCGVIYSDKLGLTICGGQILLTGVAGEFSSIFLLSFLKIL